MKYYTYFLIISFIPLHTIASQQSQLLNNTNKRGQFPLHALIGNKKIALEAYEQVLKNTADVNRVTGYNRLNNCYHASTAGHIACLALTRAVNTKNDNWTNLLLDKLALWLQYGGDPTKKDNYGYIPRIYVPQKLLKRYDDIVQKCTTRNEKTNLLARHPILRIQSTATQTTDHDLPLIAKKNGQLTELLRRQNNTKILKTYYIQWQKWRNALPTTPLLELPEGFKDLLNGKK